MIWLPAMTQGVNGFSAWTCFCYLPMTQGRHEFLLDRTAASELDPISEIPLGVSPRALFRASGVCLGARKHRREARSYTGSPHQEYRRSSFARAPKRSQFGGSLLRKLCLAQSSRVGSSKSWLRQHSFEAYCKIARKLLIRHLIVVLGLTLDCTSARPREPRGLLPPTAATAPCKRERPGKPSPRKHRLRNMLPVDISMPSLYTTIQLEYAACLLY